MNANQPISYLIHCGDDRRLKVNRDSLYLISKSLQENGHTIKSALEWIEQYMSYKDWDKDYSKEVIEFYWEPFQL